MLQRFDHLVVTTTDSKACIDFYTRIMGMSLEIFGNGRTAFRFGQHKLNLHVKGQEFEPKAHLPVSGALDLCFVADRPLTAVIEHLAQQNWPIIEGPVARTGALGPIQSVYLRDPDLNLIEVCEYL